MAVVVTIDVEFADRPANDPLDVLARIREVLDDHGVPATFFVQGRWAKAYPGLTEDLAERDPTLGLHGYAHVDYRRLSTDGIRAEISDGLDALRTAAPSHVVRYVRLPHGYGSDDPVITGLLGEAGLVVVGWDFSTFDWDETLPFEQRASRAAAAIDRGGVVLFHSWPERTPQLISHLIDLAGAGEIVSLDEVSLAGSSPNGATMHLERTDPAR